MTLTELKSRPHENYVNKDAFRLDASWSGLADGYALTREDGRYLVTDADVTLPNNILLRPPWRPV